MVPVEEMYVEVKTLTSPPKQHKLLTDANVALHPLDLQVIFTVLKKLKAILSVYPFSSQTLTI